jgi:hypothetical protein
LLAKPTPRNVNLGNVRFAMFNNQRDIAALSGAKIVALHPTGLPVLSTTGLRGHFKLFDQRSEAWRHWLQQRLVVRPKAPGDLQQPRLSVLWHWLDAVGHEWLPCVDLNT